MSTSERFTAHRRLLPGWCGWLLYLIMGMMAAASCGGKKPSQIITVAVFQKLNHTALICGRLYERAIGLLECLI